MGTERKRKVSLFDVVDDSAISKLNKTNGAVSNALINRWNGKAYSQRYYDILEKRKTLPVWHQKDEFFKALKENQTLILVGETGSGKTTQVSCFRVSFVLNDLILLSIYLFFLMIFVSTNFRMCMN